MTNLSGLTPSANLTLQWAEKYISLGWSLIPLCSPTKKGTECSQQGKGSHTPGHKIGKTPLISWTEFQTQRASLEQVRGWINKWPEMNLGVVTGQVSSLVVVDLDGIQGMQYGKQVAIRSGVVSLTGNGKQVFYKWTEPIAGSVSKIAPKVDLRADGNYIVAPPSIHPNGKRYRWERFIPQQLETMPNTISVAKSVTTDLPIVKKPDGWIATALEEMKIGNIDDTLFKICSRLRHDGYTESDTQLLLQPHALLAGATEGHLEDKIRNVWGRYAPRASTAVQSSYGQSTVNGGLVLHSPTNPDSLNGFKDLLDTATRPRELESGFPALDRMCEGGLKSERLFVVAALPNHGKTNFGIALSSNLCQQGKKVLYFSTEYRYQKIWTRYLATLGPDALQRFKDHAFTVVDSYSPNLEQVEEAIKQVQPDVFVFDYIQHISKEKEALTAFMRGAQFLQRQYNTQGVILAQIGRKGDWVENGKRIEPRMSMIEGCSTIEQAASRVLLLSETRVTPEKNEIVGVLDKNDTGDKGIINFELMKHPYIFKEAI